MRIITEKRLWDAVGQHPRLRSPVNHWIAIARAATWKHFPDPANGEWFGYLNRRGEVLLRLKGGKWKGCFHVPRGLFRCWQEFEKIIA